MFDNDGGMVHGGIPAQAGTIAGKDVGSSPKSGERAPSAQGKFLFADQMACAAASHPSSRHDTGMRP